MPESDNITEFLRRRKAEVEKQGGAPVDWEDVKRAWRTDLGKLIHTMQKWLEAAAEEKLVKLAPGTVQISEDHLGTYDAPTLTIDLGDTTVEIVPAFRLTMGAEGRVDLLCGARKAVLLRTGDGAWGIGVHDPGAVRVVPLTEESFRDLLQDLIK